MQVRRPIVVGPTYDRQESIDTEAVGVGHLCGTGPTPTISSTGLALGSTVSLTSGSTDSAGEINITTALVSIGVGQVITVTFNTAYANRPFVSISATGTNSIGIAAASATTTGFAVTIAASLGISSTFKLQYQVMGQAGG